MDLPLTEWITKIKTLHVTEMDLSLERVTEIANRLNLLEKNCPVVTVGGTNGKGSCVVGLEAIYKAHGYKVGVFTTPYLFRPNEQIRVLGMDVSDRAFCQAYAQIDKIRGSITLTPFEFNALAAFIIFHQCHLDIWLLEVGMGGRWDAVNIIDADISVITSIGIDHTQWLGNTREEIAREKAGIFRPNHPAVCGDVDPPSSLIQIAKENKTPLYCQGNDFFYEENPTSWNWQCRTTRLEKLPKPTLALQNFSTVLQTIELMQDRLPVSEEAIKQGISQAYLPGRIQVVPGEVTTVFDVSHNPAAAGWLAEWLRHNLIKGKTRAVFSMLADKDITATVKVMKNVIDEWYIAVINEKRGASLEILQESFAQNEMNNVNSFTSLSEASLAARNQSRAGDRIIVFGSFRTVAEASCNWYNFDQIN